MRFGLLAVQCILLLSIACRSPTAPLEAIQRTLALLHVDTFRSVIAERGIFAVRATLPKESQPLAVTQRIRIDVAVSSGDRETLHLESAYCAPGHDICTVIGVHMSDGHTIAEVDNVFSMNEARWWARCVSGRCGSVRVFDSRRVDHLIALFRRRHGVYFADRDVGGSSPGEGFEIDFPRELIATMPFDMASARANDGILQAQSADTITIAYGQPDGTVLSDTLRLPH